MPMPRRKRRAYPSDLTNGQWAVIEPMIPEAAPGGRPRRAAKREIVEAIAVSAARRLFMAASAA
jgi:transposase